MKPMKEIIPLDKRSKPRFKRPEGTVVRASIIDELEIEDDIKERKKIYKRLVQKFNWDDDGREEFRFCYYYKDLSNPNSKWIFGQYALMFSPEQFKRMLEMMKKAGWI